ncbi:RagB/SusD family nutrient uptake outer membrane protein [Plebeiibacterium sediminum]|uniref:RagB/SusD family nutrient uptake outer membrane protein n=1 Tax=Plebeiibacterium sediminum TaxID=2992112 RepID=A0AAE3M3H4_9BACT|nr:RagB/SusD family nutrient uptake outer membrane protein [Plebeiobacterium sediminum]MCW3786321.1 RagB/SusD family nutrient uptake outer membrane protein [Plebeiobacterium sediminum]
MKKIFLIMFSAITLFGCEDYLDKVQDSAGLDSDAVYTDYSNFRKFEDRMYKDLNNYISAGDYSYIAALCDEGYLGPGWETMPIAQSGDWIRSYNTGQALQFYGVWNSWESIRIANLVLENLHQLEGVATENQIKQLKGQAHFMRAWYYYEFLKRQGGMPYITKAFKGTDNFALSRLSYHETALNIAADCDSAITLLPAKWDDANMGRPTVGSAMALKASTFLFDASPSNNPEGDASKWEAAATAAWNVINMAQSTGRYKLLQSNDVDHVTYTTPSGVKTIEYASGFDSIFMYQPYNDEILWENFAASTDGGMYAVFTTPSLNAGGVIQGFSPSANFVDLFETNRGLAIEDDQDFDNQDPFIDRDPRFYQSIIFNGERWTSQTDRYMELFNGGNERKSAEHNSYSGFLARKFWAKNIDQWSGTSAPFTHVIYFRLAEMYLQYAEAANELGGPNYKLGGANLSAVEAVNIVRARVGMPPVNSIYLEDAGSFRERIKNERAVEFYLEGKRFFDLSRWGDAHKAEHRELYALDFQADAGSPTGYIITRSTTPFFTLTFNQKHYRWPIPLEDALMFEEFEQNPGW